MLHLKDVPGDFHMSLLNNHAVRMLSLSGLGVKVFCCWLKGGQCRARKEMLMGIVEFGKGLPHCIQMEMGSILDCSSYSLEALLPHKHSLKQNNFGSRSSHSAVSGLATSFPSLFALLLTPALFSAQ